MKLVLALATALAAACLSMAQAQTLEALEAAEDVTTAIWERMALTQRSIAFVEKASTGYGQYQERESNVFKQGEPIVTYLEPVGYDWKPLDDGQFAFGFVVDLVLTDAEGTVVSEQKGFLRTEQQGRTQNQEFSIDLTLTLNGAPDGVYTIGYTIHDIVGGDTSTFEKEFEIAG